MLLGSELRRHRFRRGAGSYDVGVGYAFNSWLRGDVTAEYRSAFRLLGWLGPYGQFSAFGNNFSDVDNYSAITSLPASFSWLMPMPTLALGGASRRSSAPVSVRQAYKPCLELLVTTA